MSRSPVRAEHTSFEAGAHRLAATRVYGASGSAPNVVSFHGTGVGATRERIRYLLDYLARADVSSACFDFSGHGESTGEMERATLELRMQEAIAGASLLGSELAPAIIGTSMGGAIASMLVPVLKPRSLILVAPAAYPGSAMTLPFGPDFWSLVRRPGAHEGAPCFSALSEFTGHYLLVAARNDSIIPPAVLECYAQAAPKAKSRTVIWLDDSGHRIHRWLEEHERPREIISRGVLAVVAEGNRGANSCAPSSS